MSFLIEITWKSSCMLMNVLEQWLMSHFIIRILIEFIDWIFKSLGRRLNWSGVALCWEQRHRNEQKIKILWPPFHLTISDTLRNWTSKIEIWPRITAFITGPSGIHGPKLGQPISCEYERCILIGCLYYVALA